MIFPARNPPFMVGIFHGELLNNQMVCKFTYTLRCHRSFLENKPYSSMMPAISLRWGDIPSQIWISKVPKISLNCAPQLSCFTSSKTWSGWWFQTFLYIFYFPFHIWDVIPTPLTNSYFSRWLLHHQPVVMVITNIVTRVSKPTYPLVI